MNNIQCNSNISLFSQSNASYLLPRKLQRIEGWIEQVSMYETLSFHIVTTTGYAFSLALTVAMTALLSGKCCPRDPYHWPEQMEVTRRQMWTVLPNFATYPMVFKLVVGFASSCCLLWRNSRNSSLQLSQRHDVAIRVYDELRWWADGGALHFVSWRDRQGTQPTPHVYVSIADVYHPPPMFGLHKRSASVDEYKRVQFFPHGGTQRHTSDSYALLCQTPFCQIAPLPLSLGNKGYKLLAGRFNLYCHMPASAFNVVAQHNKIGDITFGAPS
jgi:hypothetical protein